MAKPTTPHTESQQNRRSDQSDLEPDQLEQTAGTGQETQMYTNRQGAQTGANRAPERQQDRAGNPNTQPNATAQQGGLETRAPRGSQQGISSHSQDEESTRQEKVVSERPDAQAGVNRNRS